MKKLVLLLIIFLSTTIYANSSEKQKIFPKPVVVSFYSKDCEECELVKLVQIQNQFEFKNDVDFVEFDFDDEDCDYIALKKRYNITTAPTTLFISAEKGVTKKVSGYLPYKMYQKTIRSILPEIQE